jgi:hypothetical protein
MKSPEKVAFFVSLGVAGLILVVALVLIAFTVLSLLG